MAAKEFLNPRSMVTPGACGGVVLFISNAVAVAFSLPAVWLALAFSSLLGFSVSMREKMPLWERPIYIVLNSLIIFSFATGVNQTTVGMTADPVQKAAPETASSLRERQETLTALRETRNDLERMSQAVNTPSRESLSSRDSAELSQTQIRQLEARLQQLEKNMAAEQQLAQRQAEKPTVKDPRFFNDWFGRQ